MCKCLQIARSTYYYETVIKPYETELEAQITRIFHQNQDAYGTRKIKKELQKLDCQVSRRRIGRIMKRKGLVSKYTVAQFRPPQKCNEEPIENKLQRQFTGQAPYAVVVSDLTYVEFKNAMIDQVIETFQIKRSLSMKGCPYDNAVAEATFKIFKTEFVYGRNFDSLSQLRHELAQYIDWFNNTRIHGSLNYLTPVQFRQQTL